MKITLAELVTKMLPCPPSISWWRKRKLKDPHTIWNAMCGENDSGTFDYLLYAADLLPRQRQAQLMLELFAEHPGPAGGLLSDHLIGTATAAILEAVKAIADGVMPVPDNAEELRREQHLETFSVEGVGASIHRLVCAAVDVIDSRPLGTLYPCFAASDFLRVLDEIPDTADQQLAWRRPIRKRLLNYNPFDKEE